MVDINALLNLQARSRRNALRASRSLHQQRELAADVQRALDAAAGAFPANATPTPAAVTATLGAEPLRD